MDSKEKKKIDRGYLRKMLEQESRPIIEARREKLAKKGEILTFREESEIRKKVGNKIRRRMAVRGILATLGLSAVFGAGMKTQNLLNEAKNKGITQTEEMITIDAMEVGKDINIKIDSENINARKTFINGVQVGKDDIKENIKKEIEQLNTRQDVLKYIKNMFINENDYKNLKESDIEIHKNQSDIRVYKDKAKNGDDILRCEYGSERYEKGVYTIDIATEKGLEKQKIARDWNDNSVRIYNSNEVVEGYSENEMSKLGNIIMQGTDYAIAIGEEKNDVTEKNIYKEKLVNAISEYREEKIEKIKNGEHTTITENNIELEQE